jgi:glycosyltransferase involved in cell wall biosynthesis
MVGRLVAHKRAERILPIAERLGRGGLAVDVVGRGPESAALAADVAARGLTGTVQLHGFLPEAEKQAIVSRALLHLSTSQGEGWGLCVLEAAAAGVPTVAYDVDGLRDAVRDGETGWLVRDGELIEDVTERAITELADPPRRAAVAAACRAWAARFSWDWSAARMAALISASVHTGTSRAGRAGAWVVSGGAVAEGPVLDLLLRQGSTLLRPATTMEHLLGRTP